MEDDGIVFAGVMGGRPLGQANVPMNQREAQRGVHYRIHPKGNSPEGP